MKRISIKSALVAIALVALASTSARANTIVPSPTAFSPGVSITYQATHSSGVLESGDGFTIFDIGFFTAVLATPVDWSASTSLTTSPFGSPLGPDNATLENVHFTYTGLTVTNSGLLDISTFLGFVVGTSSSTLTIDDWVSRDHLILGGSSASIGAQISVPLGPAAVPDGGSTMALLGFAMLAAGTLRRALA